MRRNKLAGGSRKGSSSFHDLVSGLSGQRWFNQQFRFTFSHPIFTSPTGAALRGDVKNCLLAVNRLFHQFQNLKGLPERRDFRQRFAFTDVYVQALTNTEMRLLKNQEQLHSSVALLLAYIPDLETQPSVYTWAEILTSLYPTPASYCSTANSWR